LLLKRERENPCFSDKAHTEGDMEVRKAVRNFVFENFLLQQDHDLQDDDSFMEHGIVDSTGILELIAFVEDVFGIKTEDHELIPENFDSIDNLSRFILGKLEAARHQEDPTRDLLIGGPMLAKA
jgi:acyl carrier protein